MTTKNVNNPTLLDVTSRLGPDGKVEHAIAEILNETNEILDDMTMMEGNLPTGHKSTIRTGLPTPTWRKLNYGVVPSKSRTAQVVDSCGMLEDYAEVDKALADLNNNTAEFRMSEDKAHIEGISQTMANTLFYGDTDTDPEKFMGLDQRYNDLSAENADNIVTGDGTGSNNTSIWIITWDVDTCAGIYPNGSKAGLMFEDKGQETLTDANGGLYEGYRSHYKWDLGLMLKDWRYVIRIANIDVNNLTKDAASGSDLIDLLDQAVELLPNQSKGRISIYCNRTVRSFFRRQVKNHSNVRFGLEEFAGKKILMFDEYPVRRCDAILNTEAQIT